jgi:hypothetical protein
MRKDLHNLLSMLYSQRQKEEGSGVDRRSCTVDNFSILTVDRGLWTVDNSYV